MNKKLEMIEQEPYEAPAISEITPMTITHVVGETTSGEPEDNTGSGLGGDNDEP